LWGRRQEGRRSPDGAPQHIDSQLLSEPQVVLCGVPPQGDRLAATAAQPMALELARAAHRVSRMKRLLDAAALAYRL
jgi:hypothetical protein